MISVEFGIWQVNTGWLLERIIAAQECFKIYMHVTLGTLTGVDQNVESSLLQVKTVVGLFILRRWNKTLCMSEVLFFPALCWKHDLPIRKDLMLI